MNRIAKILVIIINIALCIALIIYLSINYYNHSGEQVRIKINYQLSKAEYMMLEDGDIILRHGYGFVSDLIVKTLKEDNGISHCALLVKEDSIFHVIHSVSQSLSENDGVQIQDLPRFINDSKQNSVIVLRYKNKESESRELISERAKHYLQEQVPFDNSFDIKDTTRFFCTELIWKVFLDVFGTDIFSKKHGQEGVEFLKFDVFFDPEIFEVVFTHHKKD